MQKIHLKKRVIFKRDILKYLKKKKIGIANTIPYMNDDELYCLYLLLVDLFKACQDEMSSRNKGGSNNTH